jgi:zinc protease
MRANQMLTKPNFPQEEFDKFKDQSIGGLIQSLANPATVANRELIHALYSGGILSRITTKKTLEAITLDDVKKWYERFYQLEGAFVVVSGDVSPEQGKQIADKLVAGLDRHKKPEEANYGMWSMIAGRHILLVDNPEGKQATIRLGIRAYDVYSDEKYAGGIAGQILSAGIEGRLNKYVRAEKGLTYGAYAYFRPGRHAGEFSGQVDTNPDTAGATIEAVIKVFNDMRTADVTPQELAEAKTRTAGAMCMEMQTIAQQAGRRIDQILNNYPLDYWDQYPKKIAEVQASQVRQAMTRHVTPDDRMIFVVVAPAAVVKDQLDKLGDLEVMPMPLNREGN